MGEMRREIDLLRDKLINMELNAFHNPTATTGLDKSMTTNSCTGPMPSGTLSA